MDIKQLEVFCQVFENKSFSKAAERLGLSQPTVSSHIQHLEDFLGKKLFDRSGKTVVPTAEAKVLYNYAVEILKKRNEALSEIFSLEENFKGTLKLGTSNIPGDYIVPKALKKIRKILPNTTLKVEILDSSKVLKLLKENIPEIDLGIVGTFVQDPQLEWKEIGRDQIVLIGPPYFRKNLIDLNEIEELPLLLREEESGTKKTVEERLKSKGINIQTLNVTAVLGSNTAIKEAVMAGEGFAFVSKLSIEREVKNNMLKVVKVKGLEIKRKFYLVKRKGLSLQPGGRIFWERAKEIFS